MQCADGNWNQNETIRLLTSRASCRDFTDEKIPQDVLNAILNAGIHAPTGGNLQPCSIVKVENQNTRARLAKLCGDQGFIAKAPVNLIFCIDWRRLERWASLEAAPFSATQSFRHFWISFQDTVICAQNICTAADAVGLGSCYVGTVLECFRDLRELLELPDGVFPVVLLAIGYPRERPMPRRKLGVDVMVHDEVYHELEAEELLQAFEAKYEGFALEATEERKAILEEVCKAVHGEAFAADCLERIGDAGHINAAQYRFGLHYRADRLPNRNEDLVRATEEAGFSWFKHADMLAEKDGRN
ncbi:MAG: nitroreductase family protein [Firmicutes bacterium]|jgi:nitroreductase|nr:nitroreductase family protein [Bacillota bacterium]MDD4793239.1 nitroreductase family protein [Bacillota bacterium]